MSSDLTVAPIPFLIRRLAIPAGTGFFFTTMFNVVDIWYGGKLSTNALSAMSLSFPVFFILLAVGTGMTSSTTTLVGNSLGRGDTTEARRFMIQSLSLGLLHATVLALSASFFLPSIFKFMGAEGEYLKLALSYMNIIMLGAPFFMMNFIISAILNSHGDTVTYRNFLIIGFFMNCLLDPLFMYGGAGIPGLGIGGIALATVVIQIVGNLYMLNALYKSGLILSFRLNELKPNWNYFREIFKQGFPAAMNMMSVSIGIFIITWFAGRFGSEAVAAYGIATRIEQIALLPVMGLNISTMALVAQNFGAERYDRIFKTVTTSIYYGFVISTIGTLFALFFTLELLQFFTSDPKVLEFGRICLTIESKVFPAYVILYVSVSAMQGIKCPNFGLWIGLYRQIAAPIALFYILISVLGFGIVSLWWGIFGITWSAACFVAFYVILHLKKLSKGQITA